MEDLKNRINQFTTTMNVGECALLAVQRVRNVHKDGVDTGQPQYQGNFGEIMNVSNNNNNSALQLLNLDDSRFKRGARRAWVLSTVKQLTEIAKNSGITLKQEDIDKLQIGEGLFVGAKNAHLKMGDNQHNLKLEILETFEMDSYQAQDPENRCKRAGKDGPIIYGDNNGTRAMIFSNVKVNMETLNTKTGEVTRTVSHTLIPEMQEATMTVEANVTSEKAFDDILDRRL